MTQFRKPKCLPEVWPPKKVKVTGCRTLVETTASRADRREGARIMRERRAAHSAWKKKHPNGPRRGLLLYVHRPRYEACSKKCLGKSTICRRHVQLACIQFQRRLESLLRSMTSLKAKIQQLKALRKRN